MQDIKQVPYRLWTGPFSFFDQLTESIYDK